VAIVAVALLLVASLSGGRGDGRGMMGGMMGGWGFSPLGWIGMTLMWLIPIGFLVLTVLGIIWLVRTIGSGNQSALFSQACSSCGRAVQGDWRNCPHCGTQLVK
jgi:hypothetical protein